MATRVKYNTPDGGTVESVLVGANWDTRLQNAEGETISSVTLTTEEADDLFRHLFGL